MQYEYPVYCTQYQTYQYNLNVYTRISLIRISLYNTVVYEVSYSYTQHHTLAHLAESFAEVESLRVVRDKHEALVRSGAHDRK